MDDNFVLDRIEELCREKSMSHYRLALKSGIHQSSLSTLLHRRSTPNVFTLDKICKGFDITLAQFFSPNDQHVDLTESEEHILTMWDNLGDIEKKMVTAYIEGMLAAQSNAK